MDRDASLSAALQLIFKVGRSVPLIRSCDWRLSKIRRDKPCTAQKWSSGLLSGPTKVEGASLNTKLLPASILAVAAMSLNVVAEKPCRRNSFAADSRIRSRDFSDFEARRWRA
jgi:hypothetical protein